VDTKLLVVSCFANFLCDDVRDSDDTYVFESVLDRSLKEHFEMIVEFCEAHPSVKVGVAIPLLRQIPSWFESDYDKIKSRFISTYDGVSRQNLHLLRAFSEKLSFYDGVHLTGALGVRYVNHLVEEGWQIFDQMEHERIRNLIPENIPVQVTSKDLLTSSSMSDMSASSSSPLTIGHFNQLLLEIRKNNVSDRVATNESKIDVIEKVQKATTFSTDLAMARIYEEQDFTKNSSRENRVTLGSLHLSESLPKDRPGQLSILKSRVQSLIDDLYKQGSKPEILGISLKSAGLTPKGAVRDFDIIFKSPSQAFNFRKVLGVESRKDGPFKGLYVSNCVTHSTKVRIDILSAIARKLSTNTKQSFCQSFISRPVLHLRNRDGAGQSRVFTFVDAVREFGDLMSKEDLSAAYRRAGSIYSGVVSRFFVILKDRGSTQAVRQSKRPRDSDEPIVVHERSKKLC